MDYNEEFFERKIFSESALQYSHRQPGNRGEFAIVARHSDFPDLCGASDANGFRDSRDPSAARRTQVIAIDFQADRVMCGRVDDHVGSNTPNRFGQHYARATMKQPEGLRRPVIDRHPAFQKIRADFRELKTHVGQHVNVIDV